MFRLSKFVSTVVVIGVAFLAPPLHAEMMPGSVMSPQEAEAIMKERSEFMKGLGRHMKAFSNFLKRGDGELFELSAMATEIAEDAPRIPELFPENTGMEQYEEDSEAKPVIWQKWNEFVDSSNALVGYAEAAATAFDSGDKRMIGKAVKDLGSKGCGGCHKKFREKRN